MTTTTGTDFIDLYQILQVERSADAAAIRAAIRAQRRTWNKRASQSDATKRQQAEQRVAHLAEAERVLLDASRRAQYDRDLLAASASASTRPGSAATAASEGGTWLERARQFFDDGDPSSAYYAAREAIQENGANHEAWSIRANSSFLMNEFKDAEFEFNEAIRLDPDNPSYHFDLAESRAERGEWVDAMRGYEAAARLDAANPVYRAAIANVYLQNELPDKALPILEEVVRDHPQDTHFQYYLALALHDSTIGTWASIRGGGGNATIISEAQIAATRSKCSRALALTFDDGPLRASLEKNMTLADEAEEVKFFHSNVGGWFVTALIAFAFIWFYGLGIILLPAVIYAYVYTHRMPVWKYQASLNAFNSRGI